MMNTPISIRTFKSAILSGICVGIAGWGYLATMNIIGAVLFSFGLLAVVNYKLALYTGTAGFVPFGGRSSKAASVGKSVAYLIWVLAGNIVGCLLVALLSKVSPLEPGVSAQTILDGRLAAGPLKCGLLAIGCGFIMTTIVTFARQGKMLPMLFGIPVFILCGFPHCVADAFYYLAVPTTFLVDNWADVLPLYLCIVLGNFVGCNFYRIVMGETSPAA